MSTRPKKSLAVWALLPGIWLGLSCAGGSCGGGDDPSKQGRALDRSRAAGVVVITVDGDPISLSEVEDLVAASSLTPLAALRRLQAERLLIAEASRRGVRGPEIDFVSARARVQALLRIEVDSIRVSDEELREAFAKDARFHVPERRKSFHVLAKLTNKSTPAQKQAAKELATAAIAELGSTEPSELEARYRGKGERGVDMKAEFVPLSPRDGALAEEYKEALFSLSAVGVVPRPIETKFGWHAIRVIEIAPPVEVSFDDAQATLRDELLSKKREARVDSLLTELRQSYLPKVEATAASKLAWVTDP